MQTEEDTVSSNQSPSRRPADREPEIQVTKDIRERLSPERLDLLERTLGVRRRIGKVATNVTELVDEMRERGA